MFCLFFWIILKKKKTAMRYKRCGIFSSINLSDIFSWGGPRFPAWLYDHPQYLCCLLLKLVFWRLNDSNAFRIEKWIPFERCCTFHYLSWTDSIKPSLQFSFLYFEWLLSRDRHLPDFIYVICRLITSDPCLNPIFYLVPSIVFSFRVYPFYHLGTIRHLSWNDTWCYIEDSLKTTAWTHLCYFLN